ncbi:MAG: lysophospholipid acyltransferase family protein [Pseudomonadales bacterium]|nr:lysophospholipid acyltransferase family protein [Pseudomonadales bacterium]
MNKIKARLAVGLIRIVSLLSLASVQKLGAFLGMVLWRTGSSPAKVTKINIDLCFPERSEAEREKLAAQSLQETCKTFLEMGAIWEWPVSKSLGLVREVKNKRLFDEARASGQGLIVLGPHLGNWELSGLYLSSLTEMAALYRPPKVKELETYMSQVRGRSGSELVPTDKRGVIRLFSILKRGGVVGVLPDQVPDDSGGVFVPFFGVPANTIKLVSKMVEKTGARVLCLYAQRLPSGHGFILVFRDVDPLLYSRDLTDSVTGLNKSVERCVLDIPTQYQWEYKRFKHYQPGRERYY